MNPLPFILAAYVMIVGGLGAYVVLLWRRLAQARRELDSATPTPDPPRDDG